MGVTGKGNLPYPESSTLISESAPIVQELAEKIDDAISTVTTGPEGPAGADGAPGTDGKGWTGGAYDPASGVVTFESTDGLGFSTADLRGATGPEGPAGSGITFKGDVADLATLNAITDAVLGDAYFVTAEGEMYAWSEAGEWVNLGAVQGADGPPGADGDSAYDIWLAAGNAGTEAEFLASLVGEKGEPGDPGEKGDPGDPAPLDHTHDYVASEQENGVGSPVTNLIALAQAEYDEMVDLGTVNDTTLYVVTP